MNLEQLNDLDFDSIGSWPPVARWALSLTLVILVLAVGGYLWIGERYSELQAGVRQERQLKQEYRDKYQFSAHLERHQQELVQTRLELHQLLSMLPSRDEMPGLLDDVTFLAAETNLSIVSIGWLPERAGELYTELPLSIELRGGYVEFGHFVAGMAALPRIVSLDDFSVTRQETVLSMKLVATTYRLLASAEAP
ncbi:type IV pilus assembly protein PilO [Ferrimonas sediminum]|uniref:Type IV pilus assembly protein PilO n=1 Tax=Ferrimonas sediminum TaxID=718193 RepID=A0A1G8V6T3_9GAMM|nr:type 4a pilus biogenesis protein PilO [Ferrimonas sediminum]SDJ61577.1 type IV pilus assembly protein PilO [Ferrimonas sediminum]